MRLHIQGDTDVGKKRTRNEDSLYYSEEGGLCIVADGMGGLSRGDVASQMAVELFTKRVLYDSPTALLQDGEPDVVQSVGKVAHLFGEWLRKTNAEVFQASRKWEREGPSRMGTTIAALYQFGQSVIILNVGDTRIYRLRDGKLTQLSEDHSWVAEMRRSGAMQLTDEQASRLKNVITRALGVGKDVQPSIQARGLRMGDLFLLCTDGLSNLVEDREIESILLNTDDDLAHAVETLIDLANRRGGTDNITVVLARAED